MRLRILLEPQTPEMAPNQSYNKTRQCDLSVVEEFTLGSFEISDQAGGGEVGEKEEQKQQEGGRRGGQGRDEAGKQEAWRKGSTSQMEFLGRPNQLVRAIQLDINPN